MGLWNARRGGAEGREALAVVAAVTVALDSVAGGGADRADLSVLIRPGPGALICRVLIRLACPGLARWGMIRCGLWRMPAWTGWPI